MTNTVLIALLALAVPAFPAGKAKIFHVSVFQDSVVEGKAIKAGDYKLQVENGQATFKNGKDIVSVPAKEVTAENKAQTTELEYNETKLQDIRIGGTDTKIVFDQTATGNGSGI